MSIGFQWTQKLSVGNDVIDAQHQSLFVQTNKILEILTAEDTLEKTHEIFLFLDQYIETHFATEHAYMEKYQYPYIDEHEALHEEFKKQYAKFKERLEKEGPSERLLMDTENYLSNWLLYHIGNEDAKYASYVESIEKA